MNQQRNNQERDDNYQNVARIARNFQNRGAGPVQPHPNLNPNYQNPVDVVRNYNRQSRRQQQEPEENIYERLDNDDDDDDDNEQEHNAEVASNEAALQNNQNLADNHTYERIDDRISCRGGGYSRYKYHVLNHVPVGSLFNEAESRHFNQYDQPRHVYLDSSRLGNQFCQSRLGRLGRNCFSTENIAYASSRRSMYSFGSNCMCPFCRYVDTRYVCHHCQSLHSRRRYQDIANFSRHYIYHLPRNCRCPFCRRDYSYVKLPINSERNRTNEQLRGKECYCRNSANCVCRNKTMPNSNSTMQVGRYIDWISRIGSLVNNPLYATIHVGRIDRPCSGSSSNSVPNAGTSSTANLDAGASTSSAASNEAGPSSSNLRSIFASYNPSTSGASVCTMNRSNERQHTCDDSCIRNQNGNIAGICQFLSRCERAECNHNRLSVHWWFVNRWLPSWNPHSSDRNVDNVPVEEEPPEQQDSDTDDP